MEGNSWKKEQLNNGGFAYIIFRKHDRNMPLMIHFGLRTVHLVICGLCLCARLFKLESNLEDIAQWCSRHWIQFSGTHDTIVEHDKNECHSQGVLSKIIADSIGMTNTRQSLGANIMGKRRSILLPESWLVSAFGPSKINRITEREQQAGDSSRRKLKATTKVCNVCLEEVIDATCCSANHLISVNRLQATRRVEPIFCTNDETLLAHEATVLERLSSTVSVIAPPPPAPHYPPPPQNVVNSSPAPPLLSTTNTTPEPPPTLLPSSTLMSATPASSSSTHPTLGTLTPLPFPSLSGETSSTPSSNDSRVYSSSGLTLQPSLNDAGSLAQRTILDLADKNQLSTGKRHKTIEEQDDMVTRMLALFMIRGEKPNAETNPHIVFQSSAIPQNSSEYPRNSFSMR